MSSRPYDLPPLTSLTAFEAAARHGSVKQAAQELNVTPGAVSHQIKALETDLGIRLFDRLHRGIALTDDGRSLFAQIETAFATMSRGIATLRRAQADRPITISATTAVSALWLTPRITRFWREHPDIRINQIVTDSRTIPGRQPDLRIVYGAGDMDLAGLSELFQDDLVPVGAPDHIAALAGATLTDLAAQPLVHMDAEDRNWTTWDSWFAALGQTGPVNTGTRVNNYMIALQAAQDGVGLVLGWRRLVSPLIETGALAALDRFTLPAPSRFHLQHDKALPPDAPAARLAHWLLTPPRMS